MCYGINCQEEEIDIEHMREGGRERSCRKNSFKPLAAKLISLLKFLAVHKQNLIVMLLMEHTSKHTHTDTSKHPHRRIHT